MVRACFCLYDLYPLALTQHPQYLPYLRLYLSIDNLPAILWGKRWANGCQTIGLNRLATS